jgi:uncharacterized protein YecE (DUF72 family)
MWAHRPWTERFLPADTKPNESLGAYALVCNAVEGNTTFYALPDESTVARWAAQAPHDFRFVFKLPREITHERRLIGAGPALREFLQRMAPLADRMGPTSIQLPPSFSPHDLAVLDTFTRDLPRDYEWAVEVRHRGFFAGGTAERPLDEMLRERAINRVILDTRALRAGPRTDVHEDREFRTKPDLPVRPVATGRCPVVRFVGQSDPDANPPFWRPWIGAVSRWLRAGLEPFVFIHTPDNVWSPALARQFHAEVERASGLLDPLPETPAATAVRDQSSLFDS